MSDEEHRGEPRITVNHEFATIEEFISEYVSNLSRSGVFVKTDDPLPVGTKVDLAFSVIAPDFETIEGIGEVVRVEVDEQGVAIGMGVAFTELTTYSKRLIERLLIRAP